VAVDRGGGGRASNQAPGSGLQGGRLSGLGEWALAAAGGAVGAARWNSVARRAQLRYMFSWLQVSGAVPLQILREPSRRVASRQKKRRTGGSGEEDKKGSLG
jgi:hypothetical protein